MDQAPAGDADAFANAGCLGYRGGDFAGAARSFEDAVHALGRLVGRLVQFAFVQMHESRDHSARG